MSLPAQSLLSAVKKDSENKIFYHADGETHVVTLSGEGLTIREAIMECVEKLNSSKQLGLSQNVSLYEVYGARKSGKQKDGLPAFEKSQLIRNTTLRNFCLVSFNLLPRLKSKGSMKSIQTEITMDSAVKPETSESPFFGCFCLRKGSLK